MNNESVNLNIKNMSVKFYLCKPNRETIYPLNDIFNKRYVPRIGELATLSFSFHSTVLKDNEFVPNPLLDKLKGHYLIKMVMDGITQYFIITNQNKSFSSSDEIVNVQCYLEPYELTKRNLRGIEETSKSLRHLVTMCLEETNWSIDYIDGDVELLRRSYETSNATILQSIFELAEKFNCIVEFNSHERTISFKKYENIGINKGIRFKEGIFLESFDLDIKDEDIVTRLVAYGENGLEFRSLTPNGVNYLQDFSWFMYPFECDANYNVLKSSNYMSDELCIALVKYHTLLDSVDNQFETLRLNLINKQSEGALKQQQLADLNAEMTIINSSIDVLNATYQDSAPSRTDHQELIRRKNEKQLEINAATNQLNTITTEITVIQQQIITLQATISPTSNFTQNELRELTKFIREYEYTNDSIITAQDLLDETELVFEDLKQPPLSLTMTVETFADYFDVKLIKKLALGDIVKLQSKTLKVDVTAKIHGFDYDLDNMTVSLDIANVKSMMDADTLFAKSINAAINTSNTVNLDKYKWREGQNANTLVNQIIQGEFDTAKNVLVGGTANSVTITERGLYNRDVQNPNTYMVINNGILAITPDGGNTVSVAISKNGVHADKIFGRLIMGNQLVIESDSGILESNGATTTIFDRNKAKRVELGEYVDPNNASLKKYGLRIYDGAIDIRTSSNVDRGVQLDSNGFRSFNSNGVRTFDVNSSGTVSIVGSLNIKTSADTNRGIVFDGTGISGYNSSGTRTFYVDTNGNLTANSATISGIVNATGGTISGDLSVTGILRGATVIGGSISGASITGVSISGTSISGGSISGTSIIGGAISGGSISGASITGGSITSSTTINVSTDLIVGNNVYIGNDQYSVHNKKLAFNNNAYIQSEGYSIRHHGLEHRFYGVVDFNYASSVNFGSNAPIATARFG